MSHVRSQLHFASNCLHALARLPLLPFLSNCLPFTQLQGQVDHLRTIIQGLEDQVCSFPATCSLRQFFFLRSQISLDRLTLLSCVLYPLPRHCRITMLTKGNEEERPSRLCRQEEEETTRLQLSSKGTASQSHLPYSGRCVV